MSENLSPDFDKKPQEEDGFPEDRIIIVTDAAVELVMSSLKFALSLTLSKDEDPNAPY